MTTTTTQSKHINTSADHLRKVATFGRLFLQRESGSAATEYAFFLAMIVGGILVAVQLLSHTTDKAFQKVAVAAGNGQGHTAGSATAKLATKDEVSPQQAVATSINWRAYVPMAQAATMVVLIGLWLLMRREMSLAHKIVTKSTVDDSLSEKRQKQIFIKRQEILNALSGEMEALMDSRLEVSHLMSEKLHLVSPSTSAQEVAVTMERHHIRHLLVCDKQNELLGIISDRDLRKTEAGTARELMTPDPMSVGPDSLVSPAVTLMMKECISALPVIEDGRAVGMLTSTDLMMALQCSMQVLQKVAFIVSPSQAENLEEGTLAC